MSMENEVITYKPTVLNADFFESMLFDLNDVFDDGTQLPVEDAAEREKSSTGSADAESGFIPEGAIGKTVGLSYGTEANL